MSAELSVGMIIVSVLFSLIEVLIVLSVVLINAVIC
jgi:prepilin-type N-terminal cleavage/methylation domain-containing protein